MISQLPHLYDSMSAQVGYYYDLVVEWYSSPESRLSNKIVGKEQFSCTENLQADSCRQESSTSTSCSDDIEKLSDRHAASPFDQYRNKVSDMYQTNINTKQIKQYVASACGAVRARCADVHLSVFSHFLY